MAVGPKSGCTGNALKCGAANDVQQCQSGTWVSIQSCPLGCTAGACATSSTSCTPAEYSCIGNDVVICNASGTAWLYSTTCAGGCASGLCTGACTPGTTRCDGGHVDTCAADGMSWTMTATCASGCDSGQCVLDRLDVTTDMDLNGLVIVAGPVNVFGGATLHSSMGNLTLRAQSITVDAGSAIVAAPTGTTPTGRGGNGAYCTDRYNSHSGGGGGGYGTAGYNGVEIGDTCGGGSGSAWGSTQDDVVSAGSQGGDETTGGTAGGFGGGVLHLIASTITISGTVSADGQNGSGSGLGSGGGSGGGILIAADKLTIAGTVSAQGGASIEGPGESGQGGQGRVKLLYGSSHSLTGTITGVSEQSVMPPLDLSSVTHPNPSLFYNDNFDILAIGFTPPFPSKQGYYWLLDGNAQNPPNAGDGTLSTTEALTIPSTKLLAGSNYVHFITIDAMTNLGTIESTLQVNLNTTPPSLSSMTHPDQNAWSMNVNPLITWSLPNGDANYSGVRYVFDHYGTTVPAASDTFVPISQHQVLRTSVAPGIWAFHAVSVDTAGNPTRAAAHYQFRIGNDPGSGTVLGQVNGPSGGVANATVSLNRGLLPTQATSSTGVFDLTGVPAGTWELSVSASGLMTSTEMLTVTAGNTTNVTVTLTP